LKDSRDKTPKGRQKPRQSRRRTWIGRLAALGLCFAILLAAEGILSLVGYGGPTTYFITQRQPSGQTVYVPNGAAFMRTFATGEVFDRTGALPILRRSAFVLPKPDDTCRIFVLGESAVFGFPHWTNGAFPQFLEVILDRTASGKRIEVINCGVTAISSFSIVDIAREVVRYEPDLIIVYAGHNEFYGAYGAASMISLGTTPRAIKTLMWLRKRRLYMAMADLAKAIAGGRRAPEAHAATNLIDVMARDKAIRHGGALYERTKSSFRTNLRAIVDMARERDVPVILSTVAFNVRDCAPMGSVHAEGLSAEQVEKWNRHFDAGKALAEKKEWAAAADEFEAAKEVDPEHAETRYRLARALESAGRIDHARTEYYDACTLDAVRFRADGEFNKIVKDLVASARDDGVTLADAAAAVQEASRDGIPGCDLLHEHVHPNLRGNYVIAEALARAFAQSPFSSKAGQWDWDKHGSFEECLAATQFDATDEWLSLSTLEGLYLSSVFENDPNTATRLREIRARMKKLRKAMDEVQTTAIGELAGSGRSLDYYDVMHTSMAVGYARSGEYERAITEAQKVIQSGVWCLAPESRALAYRNLGMILLNAGRLKDAETTLAVSLQHNPEDGETFVLLSCAFAEEGNARAAAYWRTKALAAGAELPRGLDKQIEELKRAADQ